MRLSKKKRQPESYDRRCDETTGLGDGGRDLGAHRRGGGDKER